MYKTFDYLCRDCGTSKTELVDSKDVPEHIECPECSNDMVRRVIANICRVSYPDGTTDRFKYAKEKRALDKAKRAARKAGKRDEAARIQAEISQVKESSKRDSHTNICKVSPQEK